MKIKSCLVILSACFTFFAGCAAKDVIKETPPKTIYQLADEFKTDFSNKKLDFKIPQGSRLDTIKIDTLLQKVGIYFNKQFAGIPFRGNNVEEIYSSVKNYFGKEFEKYDFRILSLHNMPIEELIPNYYREDETSFDCTRLPLFKDRPAPVVTNISKAFIPGKGLFNRNILLWHSHGWYYSNTLNRWEWQRPRLFQAVEDKIPMSFVIPYLVPMLENAGANVFIPRERDIQKNEVVVDNDSPGKMYVEKNSNKNIEWQNGNDEGFAVGNPPYSINVNPFKQGTSRTIKSDTTVSAEVSWIPDIPEEGFYGIYVSYSASEENASDAHYTVYHEGGKTEFVINQQIGGGTWIWLSRFKFKKGFNPETGKVVLTNRSKSARQIISADAVRFGGGMGIVERNGMTSGRAKFLEGARYWLQYAGMPDTLVYSLNKNRNDYNDDYQSRSEYGNYLYGAPYGPNRNRNEKGLGVPIDISLAFHTDAGITANDTVIGTLLIYSVESTDSQLVFPDSLSRFANRDFADIMQTQIVEDIRAKYDPVWNRRDLREAPYSENMRPNIPSVLLELLSHQNFLDMQFVLDPRFRFDVARAIYKSMLRFLSVQNNFEYQIQPLPVTHFSSEIDSEGNILLKWKPKPDPLEQSALPQKYLVYVREDDKDFDNGTNAYDTSYIFRNAKEGVIYSFKVTAVNEGGESFPSEILSASKTGNKKPVLIINGFDRVSGPAVVKGNEFSGFLNNLDPGVADKYHLNFTGEQYDFDPSSKYRSNDAPGHGSSSADYEAEIIAGNTFDYPYIHGKAIREAGYSFVSASDESVQDGIIELNKYSFVDLILGEEKETHWQKSFADSIHGTQFKTFPGNLREIITSYTVSGGNLFISGAYIGTDLWSDPADSTSIKFANNILKFNWETDHAAKKGFVETVSPVFPADTFQYNIELNDKIYAVESPDAINNMKESEMLFRYSENKFGAGIGYKKDYGVVVLGFPFETILKEEIRNRLMKAVLSYLGL